MYLCFSGDVRSITLCVYPSVRTYARTWVLCLYLKQNYSHIGELLDCLTELSCWMCACRIKTYYSTSVFLLTTTHIYMYQRFVKSSVTTKTTCNSTHVNISITKNTEVCKIITKMIAVGTFHSVWSSHVFV